VAQNTTLDHVPFFYGRYQLTLDVKRRLIIPSEVRRCIDPELDGIAFFVTVSDEKTGLFYTEKYYRELARPPKHLAPGPEQKRFNQIWSAMTDRVEWDPQGRIVIPESVLEETEIGREVTLVGMNDHLEIFNRADWAAQQAELKKKRQSGQPPS
jgi:MraZ protein